MPLVCGVFRSTSSPMSVTGLQFAWCLSMPFFRPAAPPDNVLRKVGYKDGAGQGQGREERPLTI